MKIILLENIKNLGKKFDVKEVKDGYARNFLFSNSLAKIANEKSLKELELQKASQEIKEKEIRKKLEKLAKAISEKELRFKVKTGEKGEIFGSVNKEMILAEIGKHHLLAEELTENIGIELAKPLKTLGSHEVIVDLGKEIKAKTTVIIEPER